MNLKEKIELQAESIFSKKDCYTQDQINTCIDRKHGYLYCMNDMLPMIKDISIKFAVWFSNDDECLFNRYSGNYKHVQSGTILYTIEETYIFFLEKIYKYEWRKL